MYKRLRRRENRLRNNGKTSNDGDASTLIIIQIIISLVEIRQTVNWVNFFVNEIEFCNY